jgi:hypothetical protein
MMHAQRTRRGRRHAKTDLSSRQLEVAAQLVAAQRPRRSSHTNGAKAVPELPSQLARLPRRSSNGAAVPELPSRQLAVEARLARRSSRTNGGAAVPAVVKPSKQRLSSPVVPVSLPEWQHVDEPSHTRVPTVAPALIPSAPPAERRVTDGLGARRPKMTDRAYGRPVGDSDDASDSDEGGEAASSAALHGRRLRTLVPSSLVAHPQASQMVEDAADRFDTAHAANFGEAEMWLEKLQRDSSSLHAARQLEMMMFSMRSNRYAVQPLRLGALVSPRYAARLQMELVEQVSPTPPYLSASLTFSHHPLPVPPCRRRTVRQAVRGCRAPRQIQRCTPSSSNPITPPGHP